MSEKFDLGNEWQEVSYDAWRGDDVPGQEDCAYVKIGREEHFYFREAPVPPLPTAPYTVIRGRLMDTDSSTIDVVLDDSGAWCNVQDDQEWIPEALLRIITGFEVLSEPRAVTAKAVLDRVQKRVSSPPPWSRTGMDEIAREFGVD